MQAERYRLAEGAFGPEVRPVVTVKYQAFVEALTFLRGVLRQPDSVGVLHGPEMAGKSTIVRDLGAALGSGLDDPHQAPALALDHEAGVQVLAEQVADEHVGDVAHQVGVAAHHGAHAELRVVEAEHVQLFATTD